MNKAVPWSIKGIDFDAREAAKEAARRDGLSLGEWMNRAIADRAAEIGADAEGFDADERLEAVAAQLARLSREMEPHSPPQRRRGEIGRGQERETLRETLREPVPDRVPDPWAAVRPREAEQGRASVRPAAPRLQPITPPRPRLAAGREGAAAEVLLEQAVAAFQQHAGRVEAGAARAMANVATLMESAQSLRADALAQVDARLAEIEQKLLRGGEVGFKPLREMIASVQDRLAEIETRLPKPAPVEERRLALGDESALRQIDSRLAALLGRLENSEAGEPEAPQEKPFAGLEQRFDALLARLDRPAARVAPASLRRGLHGAISEIAARQRDLDTLVAQAPGPHEDARIDRLQQGVEALSGRVETMRREFAAAASSVEIETLARQVAAMSQALEDVAPRDRMESLENAVLGLGERIERSRHDGMREGVLAPIEALAGELRRAIAEAEAGAAANFDGVARQLRDVETQIAHLRGPGGGDRADFLKIRDQSDHLRAAIAAAVEQLEPFQRIETQVADLSEKLEQVAGLAQDAGRAQQEGLAQGAAGWRGVESRLDDLARRIERAASPEGEDSRFDDLSRRLDFIHQALASRIDEARAEARGQNSGQTPTPPSLEPLLRALAEKLDTAVAPQADSRALEALERQVAQVSERLDSADPRTGAKLERAIEDLARRFETTRDAEREAARQAFRETLAEMQFPARDEEASREIADLREKQNASERRAQQTLSAVHETLEKVVDRLAMLEEDVLEGRGGDPRDANPRDDLAEAAEAPATRPLAPCYDFDDEDFLREPGAGHPGARRDDAEQDALEDEAERAAKPAKTNYIDVARRAIAARAAAEKAEAEAGAPGAADLDSGLGSGLAEERAAYVRPRASGEAGGGRRLPALLLTAFAVLALGAVQAYRLFDTPPPPMQSVVEPGAGGGAPAASENAAPQLPAPAAAASAPAAAPASPGEAAAPDSAPNPAPAATKPTPGAAQIDPLAVGTIPPRANALEAVPAGAQIAVLRQMAEKGDAAAQYDLAARLIEGRGVGRDPAAATMWFEKAAAQGLAQAQYRLGAIYEKGAGAPRDLAKARDYYEKAAVQGNVRAMHNLAVIEAEGVEGKPDYAAAANWFRRAAEFGVRDSQFNLAILYARGLGVTLDPAQSYVWFAIAAQQGDEDAAKKRDEISVRLDARALEAAKKQAGEFRARTPAASSNDPPTLAIRPTALFTGPATRAATWAKF